MYFDATWHEERSHGNVRLCQLFHFCVQVKYGNTTQRNFPNLSCRWTLMITIQFSIFVWPLDLTLQQLNRLWLNLTRSKCSRFCIVSVFFFGAILQEIWRLWLIYFRRLQQHWTDLTKLDTKQVLYVVYQVCYWPICWQIWPSLSLICWHLRLFQQILNGFWWNLTQCRCSMSWAICQRI